LTKQRVKPSRASNSSIENAVLEHFGTAFFYALTATTRDCYHAI
jgi:hypothetical protein